MSHSFSLLDYNAVVTVDKAEQIVIGNTTFRVSEFAELLVREIREFVTSDFSDKYKKRIEEAWFEVGTNCEILVQGAKTWQTGKVRITVNLEFCPEECGDTMLRNNDSAMNQIVSPLDDIRKILDSDS